MPFISDDGAINAHVVPSRAYAKGADRVTAVRDVHNEACEMLHCEEIGKPHLRSSML